MSPCLQVFGVVELITGSCSNAVFNVFVLFSTVAAPLYILTNNAQGFHFFPYTHQDICYFLFLFFSHPNVWKVVSHGFRLHLPNDVDLPNIFSCAYFSICMSSLDKYLFRSFTIKKKNLLIYLAVPSLSCHVWEFHCSMWDLVPQPGIEPVPPALAAQSLNH